MWMGIVVAAFIGLAILALFRAAYKMARRREWAVAATITVPATAFAYFYLSLAAPAMWIAVFGDPNLDDLSATAVMVPADELDELFNDRMHSGRYYDDGAWYVYRETYRQEGHIKGSGGPQERPDQWAWTGSWKIEDETICRRYDSDYSCGRVYRVGAVYQETDDHGKVSSEFTVDTDSP